jgi:hypothetical protein
MGGQLILGETIMDIHTQQDLPDAMHSGDPLPPMTNESGSTVRDDGPSQRAGADTAATWTRSTPVVNDNPGGLSE